MKIWFLGSWKSIEIWFLGSLRALVVGKHKGIVWELRGVWLSWLQVRVSGNLEEKSSLFQYLSSWEAFNIYNIYIQLPVLWQFTISTAALIYHFISSSNRSSSVSWGNTRNSHKKPPRHQSLLMKELMKELIPINGCDLEDDTPRSYFKTGVQSVWGQKMIHVLFHFF